MGGHGSHHGSADDISHQLGHIQPQRIYVGVFISLLVLTAVTVAMAKVDFGNHNINLVIAMLVASVKAGLVALFFMHLKYEHPLTWVYVALPVFLLGILLGGVFIDNPNRSDEARGLHLKQKAVAHGEAKASH
jgi:cytochrome c oxidase subunit IV